MADDADRANDLVQAERDALLRLRMKTMHRQPGTRVDDFCIDCEQPIEPERLQALRGATSRCANCAHDYERAVRSGQ